MDLFKLEESWKCKVCGYDGYLNSPDTKVCFMCESKKYDEIDDDDINFFETILEEEIEDVEEDW